MPDRMQAAYCSRLDTVDTIVLFIHGIQGSPRQFDFLVDALQEGYSVENMLLPGHGGSLKAFNQSTMLQWQSFVDERVQQARQKYRNIFLVGHSMGSLLSVRSALSHPDHIRGLFLTAMPLVVRITFPYVKNCMTVALRKEHPGEGEVIAAARKGKSVAASNPLEYLGGIPRLAELLMTSVAVRRQIRALRMPVVVVQSEQDEVVGSASLRYVRGMQNVRVLTAERSGHYFYSGEAKKQMRKALLEFIRQEEAANRTR